MAIVKRKFIYYHILGWFLFWLFPFMFIIGQSGSASIIPMFGSPWLWVCLVFYIGLFYAHTYYLLPRLFFEKGKVIYFIIMAALLLDTYIISPYDRLINDVSIKWFGEFVPRSAGSPNGQLALPFASEGQPSAGSVLGMPANRPSLDVISIMIFILVVAMGFALQLAKRWRLAVEQAARAEADRANAELSFLKAQVNPHFLFNTLNSIYSLALRKDERTADSVMELSNMMRYVTDEATADLVPLQSEINCLRSYINLQRLRLGDGIGIIFQINGDLFARKIAPMVLLVFVENIFKYGISKRETSPIIIQLEVTEDSLVFFCRNKIIATSHVEPRAGTGIVNVQKRLVHLYPDKHLLQMSTEDGFYIVRLTLTA